jgi:hypothetical protein
MRLEAILLENLGFMHFDDQGVANLIPPRFVCRLVLLYSDCLGSI